MGTAQKPAPTKEKVFKIMTERGAKQLDPIPLRVIAPHEQQAMRNHGGQSLQELNHRGGLTPREALHVLYDTPWYDTPESQRIIYLTQMEVEQELRRVVRERWQEMRRRELIEKREVCKHDIPEKAGADGMRRCLQCGCPVNV